MIIHAIDVKDFKGLKHARLQNLKPGLIVVTGKNGAGKSSLLDAIEQGLRGGKAVCAKPIRDGAAKAEIQFDLGKLEVRRTWHQGKTPVVKVRNKGDRTTSGQRVLDMLLNARTMDPTTFLQLPPKQQSEELQKALGLDFSAIDADVAKVYNERTVQGRMLDNAKGMLEHQPRHLDAPEAEASLIDLTGELADMNALKAQVNDAKRLAADAMVEVTRAEYAIAELEKKLAAAKESHKALVDKQAEAEKAAAEKQALFDKCRSIETIEEDIENLESQNQKARDNKAYAKAEAEVDRLEGTVNGLTEKLAGLRKQREQMLIDAKCPLEGMAITEDGITIRNVPLEQCSQAEQLRVGFEIARLISPEIKVICCREGSNLDDDALKFLSELATAHEFQYWVEMVRTDDEDALEIICGEIEA